MAAIRRTRAIHLSLKNGLRLFHIPSLTTILRPTPVLSTLYHNDKSIKVSEHNWMSYVESQHPFGDSTDGLSSFPLRNKLRGYRHPCILMDFPLMTLNFPSRKNYSEANDIGTVKNIFELKLAQTGEGIAECELIKWFVSEGEEIDAFQRVCQVQSDKATIDITSRFKGKVLKLFFHSGDIIKVGEVLLQLLLESQSSLSGEMTCPKEVSAISEQSHLRIGSDEEIQNKSKALQETLFHSPLTSDYPLPSEESPSSSVLTSFPPPSVLATPAVRNLARHYEVDLSLINGSGESGRVMKDDVMKFVLSRESVNEELEIDEEALSGDVTEGGMNAYERGAVAESVEEKKLEEVTRIGVVEQEKQEAEEMKEQQLVLKRAIDEETVAVAKDFIIPLRGYHRAMAKSMAVSSSIPHFQLMDEVCVNSMMKFVERMKKEAKEIANTKLSLLPFCIKALSMALLRFPIINSSINSSLTEITCKGSHNIGIAMATKNGLVVPNIKNCAQLSILQIAQEISRLRQLAEVHMLSESDLEDGTITVSNIGIIAGSYATPLIKSPEVAIVALGRVRSLPRFDSNGNLFTSNIMNVSWSADHRVIDGATLASFCKKWATFLENPEHLLLHLR